MVDMNIKSIDYGRISPIYDWLAHVYSGGAIHQSKASQLDDMQPGDKVLYVGVGSGADAVLAAGRDVTLACIDVSDAMLRRFRKRLDRQSLTANLICGNVMDHDRFETYDVVAANYFLNCFSPAALPVVLRHLISLVKPGGKLLIADFAVPNANPIRRVINHLHYWPSLFLFWSLGLAPWHAVYDYSTYFKEFGCEHVRTRNFRICKFGPVCYQSITAKRIAPTAADCDHSVNR